MASFQMRIMAGVLPFLLAAPGLALAQAQPPQYGATAVTRTATTTETVYTRQQVDQLIAPIALYPDPLLTHVLMAATYPQQIIEAAEWLRDPAHAALHGEELVEALRPLPWAPGVKALVAVPQVIVMLSGHIDWTQALGVAVVTQQKLVLTRVQALRHLAVRSGRLRHVRHLDVHVTNNVIVITSAEPDRVVVPVYNPVVVYGGWPDRDYPPVYIPPPPSLQVETVEQGFAVSPGYVVAAPLWSWSRPDWRDRSITINRNEVTRITQNYEFGQGNVWRHQGPVVLAAPLTAHRENNRAASQVAGTVAPAGAAAVVALPQRAERLPNLIETPRTAGRQGSENPAANAARGVRPGELPRVPQERMTGQSTPGAQENRPATAEQRGTTGFGSTRPGGNAANTGGAPGAARPGQGGTAAGMANPAERNRNQPTTGEPGLRQGGGATAGAENRPEHNRSQATTSQPTERNGGTTSRTVNRSERTATPRDQSEPTTTGPAAQHRGTRTGAEHPRNRAATGESAGRQSGTSTGTTSRSEHRREQATTDGAAGSGVTPGETEHPRNRAAAGEAAGRHGAANQLQHERNRSVTSGTQAGHEGAAAGMANRSEHQRSRTATGEPAGTAGGMAEGSRHHHTQATTSQPQEAMPGSHGNAGERAGVGTQHPASRSAEHRETVGQGTSSPGAAAEHASPRSMHRPTGEPGAGGSEPPGHAGGGEAHGH